MPHSPLLLFLSPTLPTPQCSFLSWDCELPGHRQWSLFSADVNWYQWKGINLHLLRSCVFFCIWARSRTQQM